MDELNRLLHDNPYREKMMDDYANVRSILGGKGASEKVAKAMIAELEKMMETGNSSIR